MTRHQVRGKLSAVLLVIPAERAIHTGDIIPGSFNGPAPPTLTLQIISGQVVKELPVLSPIISTGLAHNEASAFRRLLSLAFVLRFNTPVRHPTTSIYRQNAQRRMAAIIVEN